MFAFPLLPYWLLYGFKPFWSSISRADSGIFLPLFIALILAHEGAHAIGWKFAGQLDWSQFTFGFQWKTLSPYCHAKAPMPARAYRIGAILPSIVTGFLPWLMGLLRADAILAFTGALMIAVAFGDVMVVWIIRAVDSNAMVLDHASNAGCYVQDGNADATLAG